MMVYFCLSPRHHSSLLPVPLLSLCYNEERLQPELGLGAAGGGGQSPPHLRSALHAKSSPSLGRRSGGERDIEDVPPLFLASCPCPSDGNRMCPVQMVLEVLGGLALGIAMYPSFPDLHTPLKLFRIINMGVSSGLLVKVPWVGDIRVGKTK